MKLSYDLELEDWRPYVRAAWFTSRDYRRRRAKIWVLCVVLLVIVGYATASLFLEGEPGAVRTGCMVALGVALVFCAISYGRYFDFRAMGATMRQMKGGDNRNLFGPRELEFGPEGVRSKSRMGESFYKAEAIQKVEVTPELLLLYVAEFQAIIIPRKKIAPADFDAAEAYAREHYGPAKKSS